MSIKGCILPWVHIYGDISGDYRVCCFSNAKADKLGNKDDSLLSVWHGDPYKQIRSQFLKGEVPIQCQKPCYDKETLGVVDSPRKNANITWASYEKYQKTLEPPPPIFLDFRFGNICNFRCRTCGPKQSTSWIKESKQLFNNLSAKSIDNWTDNKNLWDALEQIYPTIENIYFAGGEPFVLEGHYKMLEFLISKGKTDITIDYNTNLSILKYKDYDLEILWKQFKNVNLWVSCDGYGTTGEYIRKELVWEEFNNNITKVLPYIRSISTVVSILSIYSIPDLMLWSRSKNLSLYGTTLVTPEYYSCQILSEIEKKKIYSYYKDFIEKNKQKLSQRDIYHLLDWLRFLKGSPENKEELVEKFKKITTILDKSRNENFIEAVPNLKEWYESIKIY